MKILSQNLREGRVKIAVESADDIWYLSTLIDIGDIVSGQTIRKIRIGEEEQRKAEVVKKKVFIALRVEKVEYRADMLKILGVIVEGPEDVPRGSYHSFNVGVNDVISLTKEKWLGWQVDRLKEAAVSKLPKILICVLDREEAIFALSKRKGYEFLSRIEGEVEKKGEKIKAKGGFYEDIMKQIIDYMQRYGIENIIVASPAFWKEEFMKVVKDASLKKKIVLATCSSVDKGAINEVLKRPEVKEVLRLDRIAKEIKLVDDLLYEIKKEGNAAYGIDETENAANAGAVKILLVTDGFIQESREKGRYARIDSIMKIVDSTKGEVHIIGSEHEGGKALDGLGGIGALLRYKI